MDKCVFGTFQILSSLKFDSAVSLGKIWVVQVQRSKRICEISRADESSPALIETLTPPGHDGDAAFFHQRNAGRYFPSLPYPHFNWDIYIGHLPGDWVSQTLRWNKERVTPCMSLSNDILPGSGFFTVSGLLHIIPQGTVEICGTTVVEVFSLLTLAKHASK